VTSPISVVVDIYLPPPVLCDLQIFTHDGKSPTAEEEAGRTLQCYGEEYHSVPSADGVPFEVDLFGLEPASGGGCSLVKPKKVHREFATYNLFSLQGDRVAYHAAERTLEASGNVVFRDEAGEHRATWAMFHVEDGRAILMRQDR
jgi:hypothetical protein